MPTYEIGELLKDTRLKLGMNQKELALGICAPETISRIELGKIMPSKYTLHALFERLGINPHQHVTCFLDKKLIEIQSIMDDLDTELAFGRLEKAEDLIQQLEASKKFLAEKLNEQYLYLAKLALAIYKSEEADVLINLALKGITLIINDFSEEKIADYFLSSNDIRLLSGLAVGYQEKGEILKALNIFEQLLENMENRYCDKFEKGRNYPMIAFNLSSLLISQDHYQHTIDICDKGIYACRRTGFLEFLPALNFNKASALIELDKKEEAEKLLKESYYTFCLYGKEMQKTFVQDYARRKLNVNL